MSQAYTIGFSNLSEALPSTIYRRETLEEAAAQAGVTLIVRDNDLDDDRALANAEEFAALPVDLAIIFHINERLGPRLGAILSKARIPTIAVDVPIPMTYFFGANNAQAGALAGEALAGWVSTNWDNHVEKILVVTELRITGVVRDRIDYAVKTFTAGVPFNAGDIFYVDGGSNRLQSAERTVEVLERWAGVERIAAICINDDSAHGVLDAARHLGREYHLAVIGQGADAEARAEIEHPDSRFIATTDYHMEEYGPRLIDLSLRLLGGERIPQQNFINHHVISK